MPASTMEITLQKKKRKKKKKKKKITETTTSITDKPKQNKRVHLRTEEPLIEQI